VRPRRNQLNRPEPVRRDLEQLIAPQPLSLVQACRDPEAACLHEANY